MRNVIVVLAAWVGMYSHTCAGIAPGGGGESCFSCMMWAGVRMVVHANAKFVSVLWLPVAKLLRCCVLMPALLALCIALTAHFNTSHITSAY